MSTWEVLLLHAKGRIELNGNAREWVAKASANMLEAPLTHEIVIGHGNYRFHIKTPPIDSWLQRRVCLALHW